MIPTMAERRQATRAQLMDSGLRLFAERGIMAASAVAIAEGAGYTRGAFHSNFSSKEELALAVLRREAARYLEVLAAAARGIESVGQAAATDVERALAVMMSALPDEPTSLLMRLEARLYAARVPEFRPQLLEVEAGLRGGVADIMERTLERLGLELVVPRTRAVSLLFLTHEQESLAALLEGRPSASAQSRGAMLEVFASIVRPVGS